MPAMPKEKAAAVVSLNESNFSELKFKDLAVVGPAKTVSVAGSVNQPSHQSQHQQRISGICGCGNTSAADAPSTSTICHSDVTGMRRHNFYTDEHSSPLAAAVVSTSSLSGPDSDTTWSLSPQRDSSTCSHFISSNNAQLKNNNCSKNSQYNNNYESSCNIYNSSGSCSSNGSDSSITNKGISSSGNCPSSTQLIKSHVGSNENSPITFTQPKKSAKDYIFGRYIGEGSFSNVYLAVDVHTSNEFAIKVCDKRHILRENKQEYIRREREVMHMMTNVTGFVNLSCTFQDARSLYFVMTYAQNGDLLPFITKVGSFDVDCARHYAAELVLACEQMHRRNIIHRDLKPENILLDENMHTLIADFGSAKILNADERALTRAKLTEALAQKQRQQHLNEKDKKCANDDTSSNRGNKKTIGSKTGPQREYRSQMYRNRHSSADDDENNGIGNESSNNDTGSDDMDSPQRNYYDRRRRRFSFVGTAQYVSPEVLQNGLVTPSADLWALGCIIYQMISGLPPFRGNNDFVIFREILNGRLDFPQGFDKDAEDLVRQLLKLCPEDRLGALDEGDFYHSIRSHSFFSDVDFDRVRKLNVPPICPFLPGVAKDADFRATIRNLEPGLDDRQLTRLIGMELGTTFGGDEIDGLQDTKTNISGGSSSSHEKPNTTKNSFDLSHTEKQKRLERQKSDKWHLFANNEVILKKGYVNKRKGLFARKRMLLLTTGPHLVYIDPVQMIKKGEIPWSPELRVEAKNFKIFLVHTPNRTYYLDDPEGYSLQWVGAIDKMRDLTYKANDTGAINSAVDFNARTTYSTSGASTIVVPASGSTAFKKPSTPTAVAASLSSTSTSLSSSPNMYEATQPIKLTSTSN